MSHLHELVQSSVVLFIIAAMYNDIISNSIGTYTKIEDLVQSSSERCSGHWDDGQTCFVPMACRMS